MTAELTTYDLHLVTNREDHHTSGYHSHGLILRRGQPFKLTLTTGSDLHCNESITFTTETGPTFDGMTTSFTLSSSTADSGSWSAFLESSISTSLSIAICSPPSAAIGRYGLSVLITSECGSSTSYPLGQFILLFNPWVSDDDVYMADEDERNEYVLNDSGILYLGNVKYIDQQGWNYGQFEESILDICLDILDHNLNYFTDPAMDCFHRGDPVYVGRVVSAMHQVTRRWAREGLGCSNDDWTHREYHARLTRHSCNLKFTDIFGRICGHTTSPAYQWSSLKKLQSWRHL